MLALTSPGTLYLCSTRPVWQSITHTASPPHVATVWDVAPACPVWEVSLVKTFSVAHGSRSS